MATCSVNGCDRAAKTRGWCQTHYMRWWYSGKEPTTAVGRYGASLEDLFWRKVDKRGPRECWMWTGCRDGKGYGKANFKGKHVAPHRFSYELHNGPIPAGLEIDHLCRTTSCVNPAHLEAVTRAENMRRRTEAQTHCKRGHEFTPENTRYHSATGSRVCRACMRDYQREWARERRANG